MSERLRISDLIHINADLNHEIRRLRETNDVINQERLLEKEKLCKNLVLVIPSMFSGRRDFLFTQWKLFFFF